MAPSRIRRIVGTCFIPSCAVIITVGFILWPQHIALADSGTSHPDPVALVDPLIGTSGNPIDGPSDTFPGADAPFGMLQWSPDTPSRPSGGGYSYRDEEITGFSLTHLSGPGCDVFGDIAILPTVGAIEDPANATQPFRHVTENASPGYYELTVGEQPVKARLTVTARTGLGIFTFPATPQANLIINASSNQVGVADAQVRFVGDNRVEGHATSGWFCGMPGTYTVYFVLQFNRPFVAHGVWERQLIQPGVDTGSGSRTGGWVTFDAVQANDVKVKASISWVGIAGADANLRAEAKTWDLDRVHAATAALWRDELGRIQIDGGTPAQQRVFYTALYHALLHPNIFSDADGSYRGFDDRVHHVDRGHTEFATFSGWDIYRTQIPLVAMIDPQRTSDMMRSLLHASEQMGWLPKWSLVNTESAVMGGDPADPIIAGAYAFGARNFDAREALSAMMHGATESGGSLGQGWYVQRPGLDEYASLGYVVNDHATNVSPVANGGSLTLEYATDDFSIAQLAKVLGNRATYKRMMARAQNWSNLLDESSGLITPRDQTGAFMHTPITRHGQSGFQEGNAVQYNWMVPQNLSRLAAGMGGPAKTAAALDLFFTRLDAGPNQPFSWLGNEPTIGSPWAYLSLGSPSSTQRVVRDAMLQLWGDTPDGVPGNDDLGTMSAWYVWAALGLYPQNPAVPILDLTTPLFPRAVVNVPGGAHLDIRAPLASADNAYIQSVMRNGKVWTRSWMPFSTALATRLDYVVRSTPDKQWASGPRDGPPSYDDGFVAFSPSTSAALDSRPVEVTVSSGSTTPLHLSLGNANGTEPADLELQPHLPEGWQLTSAPATLHADAGGDDDVTVQLSVPRGTASGLYAVSFAGHAANGALLERTRSVIRVQNSRRSARLAYVANYFDNTVTPVDVRTHTAGFPISVGANPRDVAVSADGKRLYVSDQGAQAVSVVDTQAERVVATIGIAGSPWGIALSPDGATAWVSLTSSNAVQPIDLRHFLAGKTIAAGDQPGGLAMTPDGTVLLVADLRSGEVTPINIKTRMPLEPIPVGAHPRNIAVSPDGKTAFVTNSGANSVTAIDLASLRSLGDITVGVAPRGLAFSNDGKLLYVADFASNTVTPIETATRSRRPAIQVGFNPVALLLDPDGPSALVVDSGDNDCVPLDLASARVGARIQLGNRPIAISR